MIREMKHWTDRWLPGLTAELSKIKYPADPGVYRRLTSTCNLSEEEIRLTHQEMAMMGLAPTNPPITLEELKAKTRP